MSVLPWNGCRRALLAALTLLTLSAVPADAGSSRASFEVRVQVVACPVRSSPTVCVSSASARSAEAAAVASPATIAASAAPIATTIEVASDGLRYRTIVY